MTLEQKLWLYDGVYFSMVIVVGLLLDLVILPDPPRGAVAVIVITIIVSHQLGRRYGRTEQLIKESQE